jgi:hypothetical protein
MRIHTSSTNFHSAVRASTTISPRRASALVTVHRGHARATSSAAFHTSVKGTG